MSLHLLFIIHFSSSSDRICFKKIIRKQLITNGTNSTDSVGQAGLPTSPTSCHRNQCSRTSIPLDLIFFLALISNIPSIDEKINLRPYFSSLPSISIPPFLSSHCSFSLFISFLLSLFFNPSSRFFDARTIQPTDVSLRKRTASLSPSVPTI